MAALAQGVIAAYERSDGPAANLEVEINAQTGVIEAFLSKRVVETVEDAALEISLAEAHEIDEEAEVGDTIQIEADISQLGNLAIHTFKQKVKTLIREAERDKVLQLYGDRLFELVNVTVLYVEHGDIYVETSDKIEGINPGQRLKCLLIEVRNVRKAPMLVFSRAHPDLLRELMRNEIPEVREGNIEIVAIARDPGQRAKVAVRSRLAELDPVGSCIGSRGIRITAISHDVHDEKIDLVLYREDPFEFIAEALSPAKVLSVEIFEDERRGVVVVPDDQISLAIGKGWRNVKLASKLTRYYLDVKSVSETNSDTKQRDERTAARRRALGEAPGAEDAEPAAPDEDTPAEYEYYEPDEEPAPESEPDEQPGPEGETDEEPAPEGEPAGSEE
jgi:N utilization substance protein A